MTLRFTIADGLNHPPIFLFSHLALQIKPKVHTCQKKKVPFLFTVPLHTSNLDIHVPKLACTQFLPIRAGRHSTEGSRVQTVKG